MIDAEFQSHFPQKISAALTDYVRNVVFEKSRYLFVWREKTIQMAYCTHCETEFPLGVGGYYFKHNEETKCLNCNTTATVKHAGRSRSTLVDDAYVVWYEKSQVNPKGIVARGIEVVRDYSGDFRTIQTLYKTRALYLFESALTTKDGRAQSFKESWNGWKQTKTVCSLVENEMKYKSAFCSHDNIKDAVAGTPFQYSMWQEYRVWPSDYVQFFELVAKYPCVEYLTKLGLKGLVDAKLGGDRTYSVVNWRGKSLEKVLRLNKSELKELQRIGGEVEPRTIYSYKAFAREGISFTMREAHLLRDFVDGRYRGDLTHALTDGGVSKEYFLRYLLRQMNRPDAKRTYRSVWSVLNDWRDYVRQCKELGIDLSREHVMFPNNLHAAHQKTIRKVKIKKDEKLNGLIAKRLTFLEKYAFSNGTYLIRPARSSMELFDEGKTLEHCVGMYADKYANGKTNLFVIRTVDEPSTPFFTLEATIGPYEASVLQCRGLKNCVPPKEVQEFVDTFVSKKLLTKKHTRIQTAV